MAHIPALPILAQIAKQAGDAALAMQDKIAAHYANQTGMPEVWHRKPDNSIVTQADLKANEIIAAGLAKHYPHVAVVSEENTEASNLSALKANDRFEIDPIDNTTGYVEGREGYSVNLGRIVNGVPVQGVVYFPKKRELFFTGDDGKAYLQEGDKPAKVISVYKGVRTPVKVAIGFNQRNTDFFGEKEAEFVPLPAQTRTCAIARGECDISGVNKGGRGGYNTWDIAGPHAVLLAAGGDFVTEAGEPLYYGHDTFKVPSHIAGSQSALERYVPGYSPRRTVDRGIL